MTAALSVTVADNVRAEMARRRVTTADLAVAIGASRAAAHRRLAAQVSFDVDELQAIAQFLDVPLEQLLAPAAGEVSA